MSVSFYSLAKRRNKTEWVGCVTCHAPKNQQYRPFLAVRCQEQHTLPILMDDPLAGGFEGADGVVVLGEVLPQQGVGEAIAAADPLQKAETGAVF